MRAIQLVSSAIALAAMLAPAAQAQDVAEVRRLTSSRSMNRCNFPGKTLPAGK